MARVITKPLSKRGVVTIARDHRRAIVASGNQGEGNTAFVINLDSGKEICALKGHAQLIRKAALSEDGKLAATWGEDGILRVWNAESGEIKHELKLASKVRAIEFSPDRNLIAVSANDGISLWWSDSGVPAAMWKTPDVCYALAFSRDGKLLATGSEDRVIRLWHNPDPQNPLIWREKASFHGHRSGIRLLLFMADGTLYSAGADSTIRWWSTTPTRDSKQGQNGNE
jgi:WD40 repeat protein